MATYDPFPQGADGPDNYFNVSMAVGPNCANNKEDVWIVQFLLFWLYTDPSLTPPVDKPIFMDGICGPTTCAYILGFQKEAVRKGFTLATDGRVDRCRGTMQGSISHTLYTILSLNFSVYKRFPELYGEKVTSSLPAFATSIKQRGLLGTLQSAMR